MFFSDTLQERLLGDLGTQKASKSMPLGLLSDASFEPPQTVIFDTPHAVQTCRRIRIRRLFDAFFDAFPRTPPGRPPETILKNFGHPFGVPNVCAHTFLDSFGSAMGVLMQTQAAT